MVNAAKIARPIGSTRIDINREEQIVSWTTQLGVSTLRLRQAIRFAGSQFQDVALFLRTGQLPDREPF